MRPEDTELLSAYEADELEGEAQRRAERLLAESAEAREVVERLRLLRGLGAPRLDPAVRERAYAGLLRTLRRRRRIGAGAAVVVVLAAAAVVLWFRPRPPAPTVHHTGPGGHLFLQLGRAAAFFGENAEVEVMDEHSVRLTAGSGRFVVERGNPFAVQTAAAEAVVHGTEFDVQVSGATTDVRVVRGLVEVRNDHGSRVLWPRESARAKVGAEPRMVEHREPVILHGPAEVVPR